MSVPANSEFQRITGVSRETLAKLEIYQRLLTTWQARINLISASTLPDLWRRHFLDSAQLFPLLENPSAPLVDVGSGAGFPGMVLAVMGASSITLVERDQRKAAFLRTCATELAVAVKIVAADVKSLEPQVFSTVTARAWASVAEILEGVEHLTGPDTQVLLLKGAKAQDELTLAAESWNMAVELKPSLTDPDGRIVELRNIHRISRHGR